MSHRTFDPCQVEYGDKRVRGHKITCGKCGAADRAPLNTINGSFDSGEQESRLAARKFSGRGWFVGDISRKDRCPKCKALAEQVAAKAPPEMKVTTPMPKNPDNAPPAMTTDDRRVIFQKLNEVYQDKDTGYSGTWTDKTVAEDLGVPRAWVSDVREGFFGPAGGNEVLTEQIEAAEKVVKDVRTLEHDLEMLKLGIGRHAAEIKAMQERLAPVISQMDRTEKAILEMKKTVG